MREGGSETVELVPIQRDEESPMTTSPTEYENFSKRTIAFSNRLNRRLNITRKWKVGLFGGAIVSIIVLFFNLAFVLWAISHHKLDDASRRGTLYLGHCNKARKISVGFHLVINVLATVLLGASNYAMQCLCAPTRRDIDRAHEKQASLDIGVPSLRNLSRISKKSTILWCLLALSNLPLHLVYNSTVFITRPSNVYYIFMGNSSLASPENVADIELVDDIYVLNSTVANPVTAVPINPHTMEIDNIPEYKAVLTRLHEEAGTGEIVRLENRDCIKSYAPKYQSTHGNLILVADVHYSGLDNFKLQQIPSPESYQNEPTSWICGGLWPDNGGRQCLSFISDSSPKPDWTVNGLPIHHCLSEKVPEKCKLQYSLPLAIVVISFNLIKAIAICLVAITSTDTPILTSGDAIASFMRTPDETTKGKCLVRRQDLGVQHDPQVKYSRKRKRWGSAVSIPRWSVCLLSYLIGIVFTLALLARGLSTAGTTDGTIGSTANPWKAALNEVNPRTIIKGDHWPTSIIANTLIANIPQVVFSMLYFASNCVLTTMTLSAEWSDYAVERKGLRVSSTPQDAQRSSYFLSLPFGYGVLLIIFSALLHWLISQSLFLVAIHAYGPTQHRDPENDLVSCGYSPVAIVASVGVGAAMLSYLIGISFRRFKSGMPVAASNSLAISAACHPYRSAREDKSDGRDWIPEEYLPLKWGAVPCPDQHEVGHCAFSSEDVETPTDGFLYS